MDPDSQPPLVFDAPPVEPRRRRELFVVVLLIVALLVAFGYPRRAAQESKAAGTPLVITAEQEARVMSAMEWLGEKNSPTASWTRVESSYRKALQRDKSLARARRGLAAVLFLRGRKVEARQVMQGPAEVPDYARTAWKASQAAYGAAPIADRATRDRYREALKDRSLGWSRFVALEALAETPKDQRYWRDERQMSYAMQVMAMGLTVGLAAFLLFFGGIAVLVVFYSRPRIPHLPRPAVRAGVLLVAFGTALLFQQAPTLLFALAAGKSRDSMSNRLVLVLTVLLQVAGGLIAFLAAQRILKAGGGTISRLGWSTRKALPWGLGGYAAIVPTIAAAGIVAAILQALMPRVETPANPAVWMVAGSRGWEVVFVFFLACVVAPIVEEFIFRGLLFQGLAKRYGVHAGAIVSSMIFAGLHLQLPFGFPMLFTIGLGLCYLYRASGSLAPCMIAHALNNTIALTATLLMLGML